MAKRAGAGGAAWLLLGPGSLSRGCTEGFVWGCWAAAGPCLLACESRARLLRDAEQPLLMAGQSRSWSSLCIPHKAFQPKVSRSNCSALHKGKKKKLLYYYSFCRSRRMLGNQNVLVSKGWYRLQEVYRVPSGLVLLSPAQVNGPSPTRTHSPRLSRLRIFSDLCLFFYFFNFF